MKGKSKQYAALLAALIAFLLMLVVLFKYTIFQEVTKEQSVMTNKLLFMFSDMYTNTNDVLSNLEQLNATSCSPELLLAMRKHVFASHYIKDIAFIKDNIVECSTSLGVANIKDSLDANPTFMTDNDINVWIRHPLRLKVLDNQENEWTIARRDKFSLILKPQISRLSADLVYPWETINLSTELGKTKHIDGKHELWKKVQSASIIDKFINHSSQTCSNEQKKYCVVTQAPFLQTINAYLAQYLLILFTSLGFGFACYRAILHLATRYCSVAERIARGLKHKQFYWLYQPIVDLKTGGIVGCEALARFKDSQGSISPDHFIPTIRNKNMRWQFTEMMIEYILNDLESATTLPDDLKVSVNIFPYDIHHGNTYALTKNIRLTQSRFNITFEVTEDEYLEYETAQHSLNELVDAGFSISIDDMGTGYSNLKLLNQFKASYVKIDRSFVKGIEKDGIKSSIIPHIVEIANKFKMGVIAEGVELEEQAEILKNMGIAYGQGWYFGKPMTITELNSLINKAE